MSLAFSWTCFYLGAHAGFGWASDRYSDFTAGVLGAGSTTANGLFGGIQAGYNWQINNLPSASRATCRSAACAAPTL